MLTKRHSLCQVELVVPTARAELAGKLLETLFRTPPVIYRPADTGAAMVSVYLEKPEAWNKQVQQALSRLIRRCLPGLPANALKARQLKHQDWAESWKRHFRPLHIGRKLLIRPSWSHARPKPGQKVLVLDPGLSFGTGQHPTTRYCLQQLAEARRPGQSQALLDAGTGSGILAVAAARLGYHPVWALDCDPAAMRVARANARRNGVQRLINFRAADLTTWPAKSCRRFEAICANLTADLLLLARPQLLARLQPGGWLIVAGVLADQFDQVASAYCASGLRLAHSRRTANWHSGTFIA